MTSSTAIAAALNWLVAAVLFGVGIHYLISSTVMPHHHRILDVGWAELTPRTRLLMLTLMKGTGMMAICSAVSLAVLLAIPFRAGEPWSRWAILLVGGTALIPTLAGALRVQSETGVAVPWWPHVALLAALGVAFWLGASRVAS